MLMLSEAEAKPRYAGQHIGVGVVRLN